MHPHKERRFSSNGQNKEETKCQAWKSADSAGAKEKTKHWRVHSAKRKKKNEILFFHFIDLKKIETFLRFGSHEWLPLPFRNSAVNPCGKYARLMREPKWNDIRREMQFFWSLDIKTKGAKQKLYKMLKSFQELCPQRASFERRKTRKRADVTTFRPVSLAVSNTSITNAHKNWTTFFFCVWPWNAICWAETKRIKIASFQLEKPNKQKKLRRRTRASTCSFKSSRRSLAMLRQESKSFIWGALQETATISPR